MSFSQTILIGNLTADPEVKTTSSGKVVARLSMATNKKVQGKDVAEFHNVVLWEKKAELAGQFLCKGSQVRIVGENRTRSYQDQQGVKKYTTEVIANDLGFMGGKKKEQTQAPQQQIPNHAPGAQQQSVSGHEPDFDPSEQIPF